MTGKPGIIAARHTRPDKGGLRPIGKAYYWLISEEMKDVDLQKGDIVRVHKRGRRKKKKTAWVYVVDLLHEVPKDEVQPTKYTIEKIEQHPPVLLDEGEPEKIG